MVLCSVTVLKVFRLSHTVIEIINDKPDKIRHIHHDAYKVLAVLIPDSVQQLPALFKFLLQFMDLFAKQIHGITISFIQALKLIIP